MELFLKWLALASVQTAATISPGPAFVMAVRSAVTGGRRAALMTALGLGVGVGIHVLLVLAGLSLVIAKSVYLYSFIRYAGAAYLIYIGVKAVLARKKKGVEPESPAFGGVAIEQSATSKSLAKAFFSGILTNVLNPKAVIFFTAVYTQFIDPHTPYQILLLYGVTSVLIEALWFSGVVIVLTNDRIRQRFMSVVHWIDRCCGGLMVLLGLKLALSK